MADLVNGTHKERLSVQGQEPSHLAGKAPYTDIGGKGVNDPANTVKVDAANGVGTDTSIPKSVAPEASHLGTVNDSAVSNVTNSGTADEGDEVDVAFDDELNESDDDDLDKQLDQFESVDPIDVNVVAEAFPDFLKKKNDSKEGDDKEDDDVKEEAGDGDATERGDNNGTTAASFKPVKAANASGPNKELPEGTNPFAKKDDGDDKDAKDGDDDKKDGKKAPVTIKVEEAVKVRIKLPNATLFESVGLPAKSQKKMATLFEAAIKDVSKQVTTQVAAHYKKLHESKIAQRDAVLAKQVDSYLNYVVEEWVKVNKVAIRTSLRGQMAESLLDGLKTLFTEHYVDVPESKVDVLKQLTEQVAALKKSLNEQTSQKLKLRKLAEAANKGRIVAEFVATTKLSEAQSVKLKKLVEAVSYTNSVEFREKLSMLRESYFPADKKDLKHLPEETVVVKEEKKAETVNADPLIAATLAASRQMNDADKW